MANNDDFPTFPEVQTEEGLLVVHANGPDFKSVGRVPVNAPFSVIRGKTIDLKFLVEGVGGPFRFEYTISMNGENCRRYLEGMPVKMEFERMTVAEAPPVPDDDTPDMPSL